MDAFGRYGTRITQNLDFEVARSAAVQERQEPVMRSFDSEVAEKPAMSSFESEIGETARWRIIENSIQRNIGRWLRGRNQETCRAAVDNR
jgi:hypothetical protein